MSERNRRYSRAWRLVSVIVLRPLLHALWKNEWRGRENIPRQGGVILAPNHMSYADWGVDALLSYESGYYPEFLIKSSVFEVKVLGPIVGKLGQFPVHRGRSDAALVLKQAEQALLAGECVIVYPEQTATRDPELWPMVAKTGVARLALATGAPVVPIAHWGTQHVLPYGTSKPRLLPRKRVRTIVGPPVDLSAYQGQRMSASVLRAATATIMADVTALLAELRGEQPPAVPYDPTIKKSLSRTDPADSPESVAVDPGDADPGDADPANVDPANVDPADKGSGDSAMEARPQ